MKCPSCQAENRDAARFCQSCGKRLAPQADSGAPAAPITDTPSILEGLLPMPAEASAASASEGAADLDARIVGAASLLSPENSSPDAGSEDAAAPTTPSGAVTDSASVEASVSDREPDAGVVVSAATESEAATESLVSAAPPEIEGPLPLASGIKVAKRFEIVALLETQAGVNLYATLDFSACPACGFAGNSPDDAYCGECGVERQSAGGPVTCKLREAFSADMLGVRADEGFAQEGRFYLLAAKEAEAASAPPTAQAVAPGMLVLSAGYASHVGMERALDEDSLCVFTLSGVYESVADPTLGLFIVADGMGGHEGGEVASKLAVQTISERLIRSVLLRRFMGTFQGEADGVKVQIKRAIADANKAVYERAKKNNIDMGSTVTMAMVVNGTAYIANVGDSRTYVHRQGHLCQVTADHSLVASLVTAGVIQPEEIYTHPERNVVYRSIGTNATVEADLFVKPLAAGDTLLVCCDGLWEALRDEGMEDVLLGYPDPQAACIELVRQANLAGGEDNISVIAVRVQEVPASALVP